MVEKENRDEVSAWLLMRLSLMREIDDFDVMYVIEITVVEKLNGDPVECD